MHGRYLLIFFLCGAFAASGVALPFILGDDPAFATTIRVLHGLGGIGFFGALLLLFGITGDSAPKGDQVYAPPPAAPRTLDSNPLGADGSTRFETRIEAAAEASKQYGRTIGLIYYNLDSYRHVARTEGVAAAEAMTNAAIEALGSRLRNSDRVERLGKGRFVVCTVLLPDKAALDSIRNRLDASLLKMKPASLGDSEFVFDVGMSIYPMGGYTGEDLIATASARCDAERAARVRAASRQRKPAVGGAQDDKRAASRTAAVSR